jgi:hypothetical protein
MTTAAASSNADNGAWLVASLQPAQMSRIQHNHGALLPPAWRRRLRPERLAILLPEPHGTFIKRIMLKGPSDLVSPRCHGVPLSQFTFYLGNFRRQGGHTLFQSCRCHETLQVPPHSGTHCCLGGSSHHGGDSLMPLSVEVHSYDVTCQESGARRPQWIKVASGMTRGRQSNQRVSQVMAIRVASVARIGRLWLSWYNASCMRRKRFALTLRWLSRRIVEVGRGDVQTSQPPVSPSSWLTWTRKRISHLADSMSVLSGVCHERREPPAVLDRCRRLCYKPTKT